MVYIRGTDAPETITGTNSSDTLIGLGGDDHLIGLDGWDYLYGDDGADLLEGGLGDDIYQLYADTTDTIIDTGGFDVIRSDIGRDLSQYPDIEGLWTLINYGGRPLYGNDLDNELLDAGGSNRLDGRTGDDTLSGGLGNDTLIGGTGNDSMRGGDGADRFDFRTNADVGLGDGNRDFIADFNPLKGDKLNLGLMDANSVHAGNQAFHFIGDAAFSGTAGELNFREEISSDEFHTLRTIVSGDTDGDGAADFEIELYGSITLIASDFIL
jgi:serralysin